MATALLLPSSGLAPVAPTPTDWDDVDPTMLPRPLQGNAPTTPLDFVLYTSTTGGDIDVLLMQFVSAPFPAQTIAAQAIALFVAAWHNSTASGNLFLSWKLYAVNASGASVLATLVPLTRDDVAMQKGADQDTRTGHSDVVSCSEATIAEEFRLVLEVGAGGNPASHAVGMMFGNPLTGGSTTGLVVHGASSVAGEPRSGDTPLLLFSKQLEM